MVHEHNHNHQTQNYSTAFGLGVTLNLMYVAIEFFYGLSINSMALVADAGHNLSDVFGLLIAWGAAFLATRSVTSKRTYGLRKATILAALFNAIILLIAVGAISIEAIRKIIEPEPVEGTIVMYVAGIGFFINLFTALLFMKNREKDINIKGAFLHMAADAGVSLGVVAAGLLINITHFSILDPIVSLFIVIVITINTWSLLKDAFHLSMDAVPVGVDFHEVEDYLKKLDDVKEVHDLHIWAMSTTENALTVHLVINDKIDDDFLSRTCCDIRDKFGIEHSTIQIEKTDMQVICKKLKV